MVSKRDLCRRQLGRVPLQLQRHFGHSRHILLFSTCLIIVYYNGKTTVLDQSAFLPAPLSAAVPSQSQKVSTGVRLAAPAARPDASVRRCNPPAERELPSEEKNPTGGMFPFPPDIDAELLGLAVVLGVITGFAVTAFKTSVATVTSLLYAQGTASASQLGWYVCFIPAVGGLCVTLLRFLSGGTFGPSLAEHVSEVERQVQPRPGASLARTAAAAVTLGTGNALGPEGPSVELGVGLSRVLFSGYPCSRTRRRQLLTAGAAAGVAAGFNAPLTGVFFAFEIVPDAIAAVIEQRNKDNQRSVMVSRKRQAEFEVKSRQSIAAVTLCAIFAAVVVQQILGNDLALRPLDLPQDALRSPLVQLPLYVVLGVLAGVVAVVFKRLTSSAQWLFAENNGGPLGRLPSSIHPALGGLFCGLLGLVFPQILFFGYSTLDSLLAMGSEPQDVADKTEAALLAPLPFASAADGGTPGAGFLALLFAKLISTSICLGSGLVGGTFAPSLFFGAVLGAAYQASAGRALSAAASALASFQTSIGVEPGAWGLLPQLTVADAPAYATVGAAAVLASVFRAPLTASLLLFELTRGYDLVLPLLVAAGVGALVADIITATLSERTPKPNDESRLTECDIDNQIVCKEEASMPSECDIDNELVCKGEVSMPSDRDIDNSSVCEEAELNPSGCDIDNQIVCKGDAETR